MSAQEADDIIEAHRNGLDDSRNYGYITVTNPDGVNKSGWLLSLRYNTVDGIGTFELVERFEQPVWILATGFWNDDGVWDDNDFWND